MLGADVDAIIGGIASGGLWKTGLSTPIVPSLVEAELAGIDLDSFWGIGQTLQFDANMQAILTLSKPALVEVAPGTQRFEVTQRVAVPVGSDIEVVHPGRRLHGRRVVFARRDEPVLQRHRYPR